MAAKCPYVAAALWGGLLMTAGYAGAGAPLESLHGSWAGDRLRLTIDAQGGHIESDCADGRFAGPITVTEHGTFAAHGSFEVRQPGPQLADTVAAAAGADYKGELQGPVLKLTIAPAGSAAPQTYTLQQGARIKLIRCL